MRYLDTAPKLKQMEATHDQRSMLQRSVLQWPQLKEWIKYGLKENTRKHIWWRTIKNVG